MRNCIGTFTTALKRRPKRLDLIESLAAEQAARIAEQILGARIAGATTDPLIDKALGALAERLQ